MKNILMALFSDKGEISMMRVLSLICVITASGVAIYAVTVGSDLSSASILCGTFLTAGITGKVVQKHIEVKSGQQ